MGRLPSKSQAKLFRREMALVCRQQIGMELGASTDGSLQVHSDKTSKRHISYVNFCLSGTDKNGEWAQPVRVDRQGTAANSPAMQCSMARSVTVLPSLMPSVRRREAHLAVGVAHIWAWDRR